MTLGMFLILLIWIAVCTSKPEARKSWLDDVRITDGQPDRTVSEILAEYGKRK